jgi:regulator of replication initiation timing
MTVSEAILYKDIIQYKKTLLDVLKRQKQQCVIEYEQHKQRVQTKVDENIKVICGANTKPDQTVIQTVTDGITKGDPIELFDPLKLENEIKELETSIENFTANIDYVLSESNALTKIVV